VTYRHQLGLTKPEWPDFGRTERFERLQAKDINDCDYVPVLDLGMTYLMFLSPPYTRLSFEPIVNELHDPWYAHVRKVARLQGDGRQ
jgi:hypothetical protein